MGVGGLWLAMTLVEKRKLLFVHIPRNAGKSVSYALRRNAGGKKVLWEHARLCDAHFKIKKYTKFCVVRNPWERMVSLYNFLCQFKDTYEPRKGKSRKVSELGGMGFTRWLVDRGKKSHNIITSDTPQTRWMMRHGRFAMDHVIRFENLAEEFVQVTGLPLETLKSTHKTEHKEYQSYYTKESREFVERAFAKDIKRWGYSFE